MGKGLPWLSMGLYALSMALFIVFFVQKDTHLMTFWGVLVLMNQATVNNLLRGPDRG